MNYTTDNISPLTLKLDIENPRFITKNHSEEEVIEYLLNYEGIATLAKGINSNNGLLVGERVIVFKKNNDFIVAEGNRRICACKLLLNPDLVPEKFKRKFPKISQETKNNINKIPVDIVPSKEIALTAMGAKHIQGVETWDAYAKLQFFALQFSNGKSVEQLSDITSVRKKVVSDNIKEYNLISYAKSLSIWSDDERTKFFDFHDNKVKVLYRALGLKSSRLGSSLNKLLGINYHEVTLEPYSSAPEELFNYCVYMVAKYSYDPDKKFNTRSKIDTITELIDVLQLYLEQDIISESVPTITSVKISDTNDGTDNDFTIVNGNGDDGKSILKDNPIVATPTTIINTPVDVPTKDTVDTPTITIPSTVTIDFPPITTPPPRPKVPKIRRPKSPKFFSNLTWSKIDPNSYDNSGLIKLCEEIVNISRTGDYTKYPIASTILLRSLLEQTLIFDLKNKRKYDNLLKGNNRKTPQLEKILEYYKKNMENLFDDINFKRTFNIFLESLGTKDYFDMVIHNPHMVRANPNSLDEAASTCLFSIIHELLN